MVTLGDYLFVSGLLFTIGFAGVLLRRNIIIIFMSLELMLNAANLSLVAFSRFRVGADGLPNYNAQVFVFFIIMLLDLRAENLRKINYVAVAGGVAVALAFFIQLFFVIGQLSAAKQPFPPLAAARTDDVHNIGLLLFSNYNLPFQIIGVLVLVATIGVVVLSKRELR